MLSSVSWHYSGEVWSKSRSWNQSILKILKLWVNEWCIYIALCVFLYTQSALQSCGGGGGGWGLSSTTTSVQHPLGGWQDNGTSALTTHQLQVERREHHRANQVYALTTHQLQVERRESHRANQVYALTTHQLQVERRESHRANQVYALTTHQLQVERRESHRAGVCHGVCHRAPYKRV